MIRQVRLTAADEQEQRPTNRRRRDMERFRARDLRALLAEADVAHEEALTVYVEAVEDADGLAIEVAADVLRARGRMVAACLRALTLTGQGR